MDRIMELAQRIEAARATDIYDILRKEFTALAAEDKTPDNKSCKNCRHSYRGFYCETCSRFPGTLFDNWKAQP